MPPPDPNKPLSQPSQPPTVMAPGDSARPLTDPTRAADTGRDTPDLDTTLPPLQPGQMLGQYRIAERLGAGGMGEVYRAVHQTMERTVALKVLSPHLISDKRARDRFDREVKSAAQLMHPNVVIAYDASEDQGRVFLVMEYVEGSDLHDLVRRHGLPPVGVACEIIRQAAVGLQQAHEQGMVHRDIKPANLMLAVPPGTNHPWNLRPVVKILDFGLARLQAVEGSTTGQSVTREGTMVGTPEYMSPEQATDSKHVDIRSDIYALGCSLYFLLSGRPPFVSQTAYETIVRHLREPHEPLTQYRNDLPAPLVDTVDRMLAKRPEDRFQSPADVVRALEPYAAVAGSRSSAQMTDSKGTTVPRTPPAPAPKPQPYQPIPVDDDLDLASSGNLGALIFVALFVAVCAIVLWYFLPGQTPRDDRNNQPPSIPSGVRPGD